MTLAIIERKEKENHQNGRGQNREKGIIIQIQVNHQNDPGQHREDGIAIQENHKMALTK
jgi:hypothetical protein